MQTSSSTLDVVHAVETSSLIGGRYELREALGEGATAKVWAAWDTLLERTVALKVLDAAHANQAGLRRVLREARATSDVVSDFVVRVQGVSGADARVPYIDMELCAEHTVKGARALARPMSDVRPTGWREAVKWAVHAARGVQAAHQQGVFHRDLKPENILVRPASRRAQVTDFGLGVELSLLGEETRSARSTVSIQRQRRCIAGTPMYMAPEAALGLEPVDPEVPEQRGVLVALDVYGLGAVLYELLANRPPYLARDGADNPVQDVLEQVRAGPPPRLRTWRTWVRRGSFGVPRRLERVVVKAMARDPARRYPSAGALADDLEAILGRRPTSLEHDQPLLRLGLAIRRHQAPLATLVSALLMTVILVAGGLIGQGLLQDARRAITDQRAAQQATDEAERQQREAESSRDAAVTARDAAVTAQQEATRARDLTQADAALRVLQAEQRTAAAESELARTAAREAAARAAEAKASRRARELELAQAAADRARRQADDDRQTALAAAAESKRELARQTTRAEAEAARVAELEKALASERSRVADIQREVERMSALLTAEAVARAEAEARVAALLRSVEGLRKDVEALGGP